MTWNGTDRIFWIQERNVCLLKNDLTAVGNQTALILFVDLSGIAHFNKFRIKMLDRSSDSQRSSELIFCISSSRSRCKSISGNSLRFSLCEPIFGMTTTPRCTFQRRTTLSLRSFCIAAAISFYHLVVKTDCGVLAGGAQYSGTI